MFWNPAIMTQFAGIQSEFVLQRHFPLLREHAAAGSSLSGVLGGTGDTGNDALVPAAYSSWQFNPNMWLGMSVNSPFGLSVSFPHAWAGRNYAAGRSSLTTYNSSPSFAYSINDMISVGAGVQIQYVKAILRLVFRHNAGASRPWAISSTSTAAAGASASPPASP